MGQKKEKKSCPTYMLSGIALGVVCSAAFKQMRKYDESPHEWIRDMAQALESESHRYPALLEALDSGTFSKDPARSFDFGLDCIFGGIRTHVIQRRAKSHRRR
jgi:hypothetical protein